MQRIVVAGLLFVVGCGASAPMETSPMPSASASASASAAFVSPPFSAEQIREGIPVGTVIRLRIAAKDAPVVVEEWTFTAADAEGCTIHTNVFAEDGVTLVEDQGSARSTWSELESHAHFPAAWTTRKDASVDVRAGHFDTWFFEVRPADPASPTKRLHFAKNLPGPPVLMQVVQGEATVLEMELVSRK